MKGLPLLEAGFGPHGIEVPRLSLRVQSDNERGSNGKGYYVGDRSGKERVFAARGRWCGAGGAATYGAARSAGEGGGGYSALSDRHGGVLGGARVGPAVPGARAHGAADGAQVRGSVQEERQERRQRCRGDL